MSIIRAEHIEIAFEKETPIKDLSFELNQGDVVSIIGPSGTGKSTLIRAVNMLSAPTKGKIYFHGECINEDGCDLNKLRKSVGMVFQSFNLFSHKTVLENITMAPMDLLKISREEAEANACRLLRQVGLESKADSFPDELSGGQKQRAAIARCLAMDPEVILFDEPTSALDPTMADEVKDIIEDLAKGGKTMMVVTHDMDFAKKIANRVFYLDRGEIYEEGSPEEIFDHPKKERTIAFMKKCRDFKWVADPSDFNLTELLDSLMEYGRKSHFSQRETYRIVLLTEEILSGIIKKNPKSLVLLIEPGAEGEDTGVNIFYDGDGNEKLLHDALSDIIIERYGKDIRFDENVDGFAMHIRFSVNKD